MKKVFIKSLVCWSAVAFISIDPISHFSRKKQYVPPWCASFLEDAYTVRKWTVNLLTKIQKCVPRKRNRETEWWHISKTPLRLSSSKDSAFIKQFLSQYLLLFPSIIVNTVHQTIPFTILACLAWLFASYVVLRCVETESSFLYMLYAMLPSFCVQLDFVCVIYAKINCVNATAACPVNHPVPWLCCEQTAFWFVCFP